MGGRFPGWGGAHTRTIESTEGIGAALTLSKEVKLTVNLPQL